MFKPDVIKLWPWNDAVRYYLWLFIFIFVGLTLYFLWRFSFGWVLLAGVFVALSVRYTVRAESINNMITTLKGCISAQNGETVEGLVCIKNQLSPGIIIMRDDLFILIPIIGRRTKVYFKNISAVNDEKLNLFRYLFAKRGFNVETDKVKNVSFWVAESVAKRWAVILNNLL